MVPLALGLEKASILRAPQGWSRLTIHITVRLMSSRGCVPLTDVRPSTPHSSL